MELLKRLVGWILAPVGKRWTYHDHQFLTNSGPMDQLNNEDYEAAREVCDLPNGNIKPGVMVEVDPRDATEYLYAEPPVTPLNELNPCPSCGSRLTELDGDMVDQTWFVSCYNCPTIIQNFKVRKEAVYAWNNLYQHA